MLMKDVQFNATQIAELIDAHKDSVESWCRSKKLKAKKDPKTRRWIIPAISFANFLYINPKYQKVYREKFFQGYKRTVQTMILQEIDTRPELYDIPALMRIFYVEYVTVLSWVEKGYLHKTDLRPSCGGFLFSEMDIEDFIHKNPRYEHLYDSYLDNIIMRRISL